MEKRRKGKINMSILISEGVRWKADILTLERECFEIMSETSLCVCLWREEPELSSEFSRSLMIQTDKSKHWKVLLSLVLRRMVFSNS